MTNKLYLCSAVCLLVLSGINMQAETPLSHNTELQYTTSWIANDGGWADFNYCINARRDSDGSYLIMNEENAFAKVLVYRMKK